MDTMTRKKKDSTPGENLAKQIIEQYNPKSVEDMQNALKDIFGPMFEAMLQGEMNDHLGYESNDHGSKSTDNRRNGYTNKKIKTSSGEVDIKVPRDRDASFEPKLVPKRKKDVSEIEAKVLAMYARGMSQRDIAETIEDIYGFEISQLAEQTSQKDVHLFVCGLYVCHDQKRIREQKLRCIYDSGLRYQRRKGYSWLMA